ncbi:MAG TPA: hypothetical protein VLT36_11375 [Candidatus Dormibacteraeota bacterium]|nr:hypothetical protein [Candidatus Dormibacteraeota bacterium]
MRAPIRTITAALLTLRALSLATGQPSAPSTGPSSATNAAQAPVTQEALAKTIAQSKGRPIYDAFSTIAKEATTPEQQARAFGVVFPYLSSDKTCRVDDFYPPSFQVTERTFSYAEMAANTILKLGAPATRGLVAGLTPPETTLAERCAILLCEMQESAIPVKESTREKGFPPLDPSARNALQTFLQQRGSSLPVYTLTRFYRAGLLAAAGYIHSILKTTQDPSEKNCAVSYLGSYGYEPALNDLLEILKTNAGLRSTVREGFAHFTDSERVAKAITEIMDNTKDEALRKECQTALELVHLKAEWRRQYGKRTTNDPSVHSQ